MRTGEFSFSLYWKSKLYGKPHVPHLLGNYKLFYKGIKNTSNFQKFNLQPPGLLVPGRLLPSLPLLRGHGGTDRGISQQFLNLDPR